MVKHTVWQRLQRIGWMLALAGALGGVPAWGQAPTPSSPSPIVRHIIVVAPRHISFERNATNIRIFRWVNGHHTPALDVFFVTLHWLGTGYALIPLVIFVYFRRRRLLAPLLITLAAQAVLVNVLKQMFNQPRPYVLLGPHIHWLIHLQTQSFPSGDAAQSFAIAGVMIDGERPAVQCAWLLFALLIAYERMYVGVHFPLDVTTGALIGLFCARITLALLQGKKSTDGRKDEEPAEG